jgi:dihydroorotate dehydrogenase electron transfer subunit
MTAFVHASVAVTENVLLARDTYRIRLLAPELAAAVLPGQFVMLRLPGTDPLLGRPFALYDTVLDAQGRPNALDIVYLVIGKLTGRLAGLRAGDRVEVWGPLGNRLPEPRGRIALAAGGIGQTPFLAYVRELRGGRGYGGEKARQRAVDVPLYYGVRTGGLAAGVDDFRAAGASVHLASDDGSIGFRGFVTALLETSPRPEHIVGCGPEPMLKVLAAMSRRWNISCHLSLETPMACGIGVCFSCVTKVRTEAGWDYRRVCTDGPIFDAAELVWQDCRS